MNNIIKKITTNTLTGKKANMTKTTNMIKIMISSSGRKGSMTRTTNMMKTNNTTKISNMIKITTRIMIKTMTTIITIKITKTMIKTTSRSRSESIYLSNLKCKYKK